MIVSALGLIFAASLMDRGPNEYSFSGDELSSVALSNQGSYRSSELEDRINKHLLSTNSKIERERDLMRIENFNSLPEIGSSVVPSAPLAKQRIIEEAAKVPEQSQLNPRDSIQAQIVEEKEIAAWNQRQKEEYARQFVENARQAGWAIELDDEFVVKSVKRIRPDRKPRLFGDPRTAEY